MEKKKISYLQKLFDYKLWLYDFTKFFFGLPVVLDLRIKKIYIDGKKPKDYYKGSYIVSSNHISYIDPVILLNAFWMRRICVVATKELFNNKLWALIFKGFGMISIDKDNPSIKTFRDMQSAIDRGHIGGIFPEGTISKDGKLQEIKAGAVTMAAMSHTSIMPIYIVKRTNRLRRQQIIMGNKIDYRDYIAGKNPTKDEINNITKILEEKTKELEAYANKLEKERLERRKHK